MEYQALWEMIVENCLKSMLMSFNHAGYEMTSAGDNGAICGTVEKKCRGQKGRVGMLKDCLQGLSSEWYP